MVGAEEVDVVRVDAQPEDAERREDAPAERRPPARGPGGAQEKRATACSGAKQIALVRRFGRSPACTSVSSVGISTSEMTKSTMMPTADPMPNDRTATTLLVASDSMPSAVVRAGAEQRRHQVRDGRP